MKYLYYYFIFEMKLFFCFFVVVVFGGVHMKESLMIDIVSSGVCGRN